jgi:thioredoxin 1
MASSNVVQLTNENWAEEVEKSDKPVLVDFWAVWCGPCKALAPTIDKLADHFAGKVKVGKLNTDDNTDIAVRYGISAIPTVLLFKAGSGEAIERTTGVRHETEFVNLINRVLEMT